MLKFDINLLFTVINLLILLFIVKRFLFKPIKDIMAKRQEEIEKQYEDAKTAQDAAEAMKAEYEESMKTAEDQKNAILKDGRAKAGAEYTKMVEEARKEADSILADARKNADAETARRMGETKKDLAALVAEAAGKMVVSGEGEDVDLKLFDEFIEKMGE